MLMRYNVAAASQHYKKIELESRVTEANAHGLVSLLYKELLVTLDLLVVSANGGAQISGNKYYSKALSIIISLASSIDLTRGGDLAKTLQRVYRGASSELSKAAQWNDVAKIEEVREAISQIANAWNAIAE